MNSKKKIIISILTGLALVGSNGYWYAHTKDLENKLESRAQAIDTLDMSMKAQFEHTQELQVELQKKNNEILELKNEVMKAEEVSYKTMQVKITAYSVGDSLTPSTVMANGEVPYYGCVAMNGLPIGTRIRYNGQEFVIKDRCGYDGVMDIYMNTVQECYDFGVRYDTIEILD